MLRDIVHVWMIDRLDALFLWYLNTFEKHHNQGYKLQSQAVSVIGYNQLSAFADLIERTPLHLRQVK